MTCFNLVCWAKMIWALFEHFTRRLIYYDHDSQILIAIRYSMTECYDRGSSVSIIKNERTHVLSRLKTCNYLIFRRKERSRRRLDRPFSDILDNYRILTFTLIVIIFGTTLFGQLRTKMCGFRIKIIMFGITKCISKWLSFLVRNNIFEWDWLLIVACSNISGINILKRLYGVPLRTRVT